MELVVRPPEKSGTVTACVCTTRFGGVSRVLWRGFRHRERHLEIPRRQFQCPAELDRVLSRAGKAVCIGKIDVRKRRLDAALVAPFLCARTYNATGNDVGLPGPISSTYGTKTFVVDRMKWLWNATVKSAGAGSLPEVTASTRPVSALYCVISALLSFSFSAVCSWSLDCPYAASSTLR